MKNLGYSQNFLVNKKLVERLISKSNIDVTDYVIEIGPGKGIITDVLSQHAGEVVAVEYDQELYNNLVRYHSHDNVTYIFGDFLKYKLPLNRRYKIFSNIPFQITADIIRKLTDDVNPPSDINIIIQREAAKKNCGIPLQKYEGFRAAIIKAQYKVEITHSFKRSDFFPSPNGEESAIDYYNEIVAAQNSKTLVHIIKRRKDYSTTKIINKIKEENYRE